MALTDPTIRVVLYEGNGAEPLAPDERFQTVSALLERGYAVTRAGAERPVAPADEARVTVLGKFSETPAVESDSQSVRWQSLEGLEPAALADQLDSQQADLGAARPGEWKPWFPVIDYDRCTNCMQCLSFCLFGVYGVDDEQRIQVQNNDNCKTNCPACSRVCPEAAIMFPKYKAGPINGDEVSDSDLNREKMKIDISALLGGDVYSMLRNRSERARSRFSKERDSDKALAERQKCLVKLASMANDIPPEVLMSLPSPEEIARKAEEAANKAKSALQR
ncbi:ferredoxin family protein [bacterium]|nr:ferredoxin family protein [bacterium]